MTFDSEKRTCRKINVQFNPKDKGNISLAENEARKLFEDLTKARLKEKDQKINVPAWQTKFFSNSIRKKSLIIFRYSS